MIMAMAKSKASLTPEELHAQLQAQVEQWRKGRSSQDWEDHVRSVVVDLRKGANSQLTVEEWDSLGH